MPGIVQDLEIGRNRYVFGMDWFILELENQRQQINEIADKHQTKIGARTGNTRLHPGVGFVNGLRKAGAVSAAATIAKQVNDTILVQPMKHMDGPDKLYWMIAVQDHRLVPGTDLVLPEEELTPLVRRYSVLGEFKLVGDEEFFARNFRELRPGHEYFPQARHTLESMLLRSPVRLRPLAHQARKHIALAAISLSLIVVMVIGAVLYKKRQEENLSQPLDQPTSAEMWRAQLPIVRANMIQQFEQTLGPVTPKRFIDRALEKIGEIEPIQDDWYLGSIKCNNTSCTSQWINNGLSDNEYLWEAIGDQGELIFEPSGKTATFTSLMAVESDRSEISSVEIASLPAEQQWLRTQGSNLQELASVGLQVLLTKPTPSQQFVPGPDGAKLIGPDTTFKFGTYKLNGKHYFMIRDAVKRLDDAYFSISSLLVTFDDEQETKSWTVEGNYVWK